MEAKVSGPRPSVLSQLASRYMSAPASATSKSVCACDTELYPVLENPTDLLTGAVPACLSCVATDEQVAGVQMFDMTVSDEMLS